MESVPPIVRPHLFKKGRKKTGGRKPGVSNRFQLDVDRMVDTALHNLGGVDWLVKEARKKPEAFMALVGKRVKRQVELSGGLTWTAIVDGVNAAAQAERREDATRAIVGASS